MNILIFETLNGPNGVVIPQIGYEPDSIVVTILPPSHAGNGRIFTTPRLIERSAIITRIIPIEAFCSTIEIKDHPSPIGPASILFASSCSLFDFGEKIPFTIRTRNQNVIFVVAIVSFPPMRNASYQ